MLHLGERLKKLRLNNNWTQQQMADAFNKRYNYNLNKSAISQYENNKRIPDIHILAYISEFFNVSLDFLLKGQGVKDIIVMENEDEYMIRMDMTSLDLEKFIEQMPYILNENKIFIEQKPLSNQQKKILLNALECALYLMKKNMT